MDAGQSGVRTRLSDAVLPEQPGVRTNSPILPQLAAAARQALADSGQAADGLAVGSTALRGDATAGELSKLLTGTGIARVALAHDSITSYLGALRDRRGAIVAAGTGCVALGVGVTDVARVDGWGNLIGDAGSGYWIGRAGLNAALRAHDGRGPATALSDVIKHDFPDVESAYLDIQNDPGYVRRVAAYTQMIADLATTDAVCATIIDQAADELAQSAVVALRRVGEDAAPSTLVSVQGKLFLSDRLRDRFVWSVRQAIPRARFVAPLGDGLDGAAMLFDLPSDAPLRAHVSFA